MGARGGRFDEGREGRPEDRLPVSVIVPAFNRAPLLRRALQSITQQRPRLAAQVIVVDDASTDDTAEVAQAFGAQVITHERNLGAAATYESGLRAASNEWVALLDDDDEWLPHHLDTLWSLTPGNVLVACGCLERPDNPGHGRYHGPLTEAPVTLDSPATLLHPENPIPSSAAMFHREAALAVGGFRDVFCEDLDLWCRLLGRGPAKLSPRVGMIYHTHPGQISEGWEAMHRAHLEVASSFAGAEWWSPGLVERRAGVTAWDRLRVRLRERQPRAIRRFVHELLEHPRRALGVMDLLRYRAGVRRRSSRLAASGEPSVAVLAGTDPASVSEQDRYEVDLSATGDLRAFLRLAHRPSASAVVSSRHQAALVWLAGTRPVRISANSSSAVEGDREPDRTRAAAGAEL
ncbi:MAG: glycosyltransferase family 2 protein [Solirubrobacterales bacterium]